MFKTTKNGMRGPGGPKFVYPEATKLNFVCSLSWLKNHNSQINAINIHNSIDFLKVSSAERSCNAHHVWKLAVRARWTVLRLAGHIFVKLTAILTRLAEKQNLSLKKKKIIKLYWTPIYFTNIKIPFYSFILAIIFPFGWFSKQK